MKVFLGGASAELAMVIADAALIEAAGHTLTVRWWDEILQARALGFESDEDTPPEMLEKAAIENWLGIQRAEAMLFRACAPPKKSFSAGMAYDLRCAQELAARSPKRCQPPVIVYGPLRGFIGFYAPGVTRPTHAPTLGAALELLREL